MRGRARLAVLSFFNMNVVIADYLAPALDFAVPITRSPLMSALPPKVDIGTGPYQLQRSNSGTGPKLGVEILDL